MRVLAAGHGALGCCGARAYLDALTDDVALWALPAHCLDQYCEQVRAWVHPESLLLVALLSERSTSDIHIRSCRLATASTLCRGVGA